MINILLEMFSYSFMQRALIVGLLVSVCASLLGVILVLKGYSMIGDGLSHVSFGVMAMAISFGLNPLYVSIPVLIIIAFLLLRISEDGRINGDALIGILSVSSLALGVLTISIKSGINTDIYNYMFGSILAMEKADVILSIILSAVVLVLYGLFYNEIFAVTFDETFARTTGINVELYNMLIASLTAITIVLGMRMMGSMLISSLIIFPAITSMQIFKTFKKVIISSVIVSVISFSIGIFISYVYSLPSGASIVVINILSFILFSIINYIFKIN